MPKSSTSFSSDKQPKERKKRGLSERTKILKAMQRAGQTEDGFYDLLIERSLNPEDNFTFKELLVRLSPIPKAVSPSVEFEFPKDAKPHVQASHVLAAMAKGKVPSDIGNMFVQSIKAMIDIEEYTDLKGRIEEIEKSLGIVSE
jgi:predicted component of type VI protein secretion system